jgi:phage terminase large subunit-like protein
MKEFYINGVKVEQNSQGIKIFTTDQRMSKVVWNYLKHEGFLENEDKFEFVGKNN